MRFLILLLLSACVSDGILKVPSEPEYHETDTPATPEPPPVLPPEEEDTALYLPPEPVDTGIPIDPCEIFRTIGLSNIVAVTLPSHLELIGNCYIRMTSHSYLQVTTHWIDAEKIEFDIAWDTPNEERGFNIKQNTPHNPFSFWPVLETNVPYTNIIPSYSGNAFEQPQPVWTGTSNGWHRIVIEPSTPIQLAFVAQGSSNFEPSLGMWITNLEITW